MQLFSTKEWEKTYELINQAAINIAIFSQKGKHLFGEQNSPFKEVSSPDTAGSYLYVPIKLDERECIFICKPIISIDKAVKVIQKAAELLNFTTEKKEQYEQLMMKCSYLQNISFVKNIERLAGATMEFLVHKLKLANCTLKIFNQEYRYFDTNATLVYNQIENILHKQSENTKATNRISSIKEDFMLKNIDGAEELTNAMFSLPITVDGKYAGTIFCYLDSLDNKKINQAEIIAKEFSNNLKMLTELQEAKTNAQTDNLTGLLNRSQLFPYLNKIISENFKEETPTSLLIFDIDDFKKYNDAHGHLAGDEILRKIANEARKIKFPTFRYGGEEFVIVISGITSLKVKETAEELRKNVEENCKLTISVGCITCSNSSLESKNMLEQADKALYRAKNLGKNKTVQFIVVDKHLGVLDTTQA